MGEQVDNLKYKFLGIQCMISGLTLNKLNSFIVDNKLSNELEVSKMGGFYLSKSIVPIASDNLCKVDWLEVVRVKSKVYQDFGNLTPYAISKTRLMLDNTKISILLSPEMTSYIARSHVALTELVSDPEIGNVEFIRTKSYDTTQNLFLYLYNLPAIHLLVNPVKLALYNDYNSAIVI